MTSRSMFTALALLVLTVGCPGRTVPEQVEGPILNPRQSSRYTAGTIPDPQVPFADLPETVFQESPALPALTLPLDLAAVVNLDRDVRDKSVDPVAGASADLLTQNAFVSVVPLQQYERFTDAYIWLEESEVPTVVTTDSVLHLYHLFFDQILKYEEVSEFVPLLRGLLSTLTRESLNQQAGFEGDLAEAARRNAVFFAVAAKLLDPVTEIPAGLPEATAELALIEAHQGISASPLFNHDCPAGCDPCDTNAVECQAQGACTCEDYTQYMPRGHYTVSEELQRYFRAMMWLGRMGFRIRSDMETLQAVLATDALNFSTVSVDGAQVAAADVWYRIYDVTTFLVGAADDLTFYEYDQAVTETFGEGFDMAALAGSGGQLATLQEALRALRQPQILSGFLIAFLDETEHTQGWRFMGQRFAPDSYVLGQMVWDHIGPNIVDPTFATYVDGCGASGASCEQVLADLDLSNCICWNALQGGHAEACRFMPKGLDVMAVMGSPRADSLLSGDRDYCGFEDQLATLRTEFDAYDKTDWRQNVYWYWLYTLQPLLAPFPTGYPGFMQTTAWQSKELATALSSWAELRHDTILYVKQSYTPMTAGATPPPEYFGYVEPVPALYARLKDLTAYTRSGLAAHQALPADLAPHMERAEGLFQDLLDISLKELRGESLNETEINTIRYIGRTFEGIIEGLAKAVVTEVERPQECVDHPEHCDEHNELPGDALKTTIAADVHTDLNTGEALEEASGPLRWVIVVRRLPDGTLGAAVGPVFSYYELGVPIAERLTDEAWREMLRDDPPAPPWWSADFVAP